MKGAIGLGLLWAIMAIGIYMTYRILDISDLTSEGSFTLGAATLAFCTINEMNPYIAIGASMVAGALAGYGRQIVQVIVFRAIGQGF